MSARRSTGRKPPYHWRQVIDECVGKALGNSFRQQILWILNERPTSQSEVAKETGEGMNKVGHHFKVLRDAKCIEVAFSRMVGNRVQHFYKANSRAFLEGAEWPKIPDSLKGALRATLLQNILDDSIDAVVEGTYDACDGAHMSWTPSIVDEQGLEETTRVLERALLDVIAIQESAKGRLKSCEETGIPFTVSIMGYQAVGGRKRIKGPRDGRELVASARSEAAVGPGKRGTATRKSTTEVGKAAGRVSTRKGRPKSKRGKSSRE